MSTPNPLDEMIKGQPLQVDIATIEEQLRELWKETAQEDGGPAETGNLVTRACVLNLVAYVEDGPEGQKASQVIGDLTPVNPCRAIVVIAEPGPQPARLNAWISAHCHRPAGSSKIVCCEQISLQAAGEALRELAPTVMPFLIADLPVFLWWRGKQLFESEFLGHISGVCDRLIIDSRDFQSPRGDFPRLQSYIASHRDHLAVSDLAWHRLMQWRELMAQFFDSPAFLDHLSDIEQVIVEFSRPADAGLTVPPQAYLLAGWLAGRLEWDPASARVNDGGYEFQLRRQQNGRPITVCLQPVESPDELCGHLVSFEMRTGGPQATSFRIGKGDNPNLARTEISFANLPPYQRVVPLRIYNEVELIARQLEIFGHDRVYEASIEMSARMILTLK